MPFTSQAPIADRRKSEPQFPISTRQLRMPYRAWMTWNGFPSSGSRLGPPPAVSKLFEPALESAVTTSTRSGMRSARIEASHRGRTAGLGRRSHPSSYPLRPQRPSPRSEAKGAWGPSDRRPGRAGGPGRWTQAAFAGKRTRRPHVAPLLSRPPLNTRRPRRSSGAAVKRRRFL